MGNLRLSLFKEKNAMKKIYILASVIVALFALSFTSVEARTTQKTLEQQVRKEIRSLPRYGVFDHISFQVNGPVVTLSGKVSSLGTKSAAGNVIKRIPGVEKVINNIEDLPPSPMDDAIRVRTLRQLSAHGLGGYFWEPNPDMRIIVDNGHVSLEGYVMNKGDYNLANVLANGVSGVFSVQNNLIVGKEPKS